jgi:hypothetical protein
MPRDITFNAIPVKVALNKHSLYRDFVQHCYLSRAYYKTHVKLKYWFSLFSALDLENTCKFHFKLFHSIINDHFFEVMKNANKSRRHCHRMERWSSADISFIYTVYTSSSVYILTIIKNVSLKNKNILFMCSPIEKKIHM